MFNYQGMTEQQVKEGVVKFGPAQGARKIIDQEYQHALESVNNLQYITYYCHMKKSECSRIGSTSKCFCGHLFGQHKQQIGKKVITSCEQCVCKSFKFVPSRPEECGMYWLPRRKDFNVTKWRPPCKCTHGTDDHMPNYPQRCKKCQCSDFYCNFACISCDQRWEDHEVLYETEYERKQRNKPIGQAYMPLSANPDIQDVVFKDIKYAILPEQIQQVQSGNDKPFPYKKPQQQQQYTNQYTRQQKK